MDSFSNQGLKLSKTGSGLRIIPISDVYASPFALSEPQWTPDKEVCMIKKSLMFNQCHVKINYSCMANVSHVFSASEPLSVTIR